MKSPSEPGPVVVTDTGPLIALARSGHLRLLELLFREIILPECVFGELCLEQPLPGTSELKTVLSKAGSMYRVQAARTVEALLSELLDPGEAEAIALAAENDCLLLIDERKGRRVARKQNIRIIGTGRILVAGKKYGHLKNVRDPLAQMRSCGYRLSDALCREILRLAGE
jgi:predicted nucleic acid-binding protein